MLKHYLIIFFVSMVPLIELRGAIPYAVAFIQAGSPLSLPLCYVIAVLGNMLPVPFIFFFARHTFLVCIRFPITCYRIVKGTKQINCNISTCIRNICLSIIRTRTT